MRIGIIFAMKEELQELKKFLAIKNEYTIFDLTFYEGTIQDVFCVLVEAGIGKVNAARTTQILIDNMNVDFVFNIGVAVGVCSDLSVGDIVIGEKLVQHDFDITAFQHEKGFIPNVGTFVEADPYLVDVAEKCLKNAKKGVIASGDIFCTELEMSKKIQSKFSALCVEMEGAAIAQVCYLSHIPFLIIRSISDVAGNNNAVVYEKFLESSSKKIALGMVEILKKIDKI